MATNKQFIANLKGPQGEPGIQGPQGEKGETGATGQRGSKWYVGTAINGEVTDTGFWVTDSSVADCLRGDYYLNKQTGNIYRCLINYTEEGSEWIFVGNLKPEDEDDYITGRKADGNLEDSASAPLVSIKIEGATGGNIPVEITETSNSISIKDTIPCSSGDTVKIVTDFGFSSYTIGTVYADGNNRGMSEDIAPAVKNELSMTAGDNVVGFDFYFSRIDASTPGRNVYVYINGKPLNGTAVGETGVIVVTCRDDNDDTVTVNIPVNSPLYDEDYIYYDITGYGYLYKDGVEQDLTTSQMTELAKLCSFEGGTTVECEAVTEILYFKNNDDAEAVILLKERLDILDLESAKAYQLEDLDKKVEQWNINNSAAHGTFDIQLQSLRNRATKLENKATELEDVEIPGIENNINALSDTVSKLKPQFIKSDFLTATKGADYSYVFDTTFTTLPAGFTSTNCLPVLYYMEQNYHQPGVETQWKQAMSSSHATNGVVDYITNMSCEFTSSGEIVCTWVRLGTSVDSSYKIKFGVLLIPI